MPGDSVSSKFSLSAPATASVPACGPRFADPFKNKESFYKQFNITGDWIICFLSLYYLSTSHPR